MFLFLNDNKTLVLRKDSLHLLTVKCLRAKSKTLSFSIVLWHSSYLFHVPMRLGVGGGVGGGGERPNLLTSLKIRSKVPLVAAFRGYCEGHDLAKLGRSGNG